MESKAEDITEDDIRSRCALCNTMDCCPEHCCNWDTCRCSDCEYCKSNSHQSTATAELAEPEIFIRSDGTEEITKVGIVKKSKSNNNKWGKTNNDNKEVATEKPRETFRAQDGALITNYEVGYADEPEEDDKLNYAGGIKGIRALRKQRDNLPDVEPSSASYQNDNYRHQQYEESKR